MFVEAKLVDGKNLIIPAASVLTYEEVPKGANPDFPKAASYIRYDLGNGFPNFGLLETPFVDLAKQLPTDNYNQLDQTDAGPINLRKGLLISAIEAEDGNIEAVMRVGSQLHGLRLSSDFETVRAALVPQG